MESSNQYKKNFEAIKKAIGKNENLALQSILGSEFAEFGGWFKKYLKPLSEEEEHEYDTTSVRSALREICGRHIPDVGTEDKDWDEIFDFIPIDVAIDFIVSRLIDGCLENFCCDLKKYIGKVQQEYDDSEEARTEFFDYVASLAIDEK